MLGLLEVGLMKNVWINQIDRALLYLEYSFDIIDQLEDDEKEAIIIEEYLFILREGNEDCVMSLEDMAQSIIDYYKGTNGRNF